MKKLLKFIMMKKIIFFIFILFIPFINTAFAQILGYPNPSAEYCVRMGYEYISEKDSNENEIGYCILPDSSKVKAWEFFRGEVKTEFSYCARKGFKLESKIFKKNSYEYRCAYCINDTTDGKNVSNNVSTFDDFTEIPMLELMEKNGEPLIKKSKTDIEKTSVLKNNEMPDLKIPVQSTDNSGLQSVKSLPESFDWRNVDDYNYVNTIKNQRPNGWNCGSCYAFAAVACAEGAYNKYFDLYNENRIIFSESFLGWCLGSLDKYYFYGCSGALSDEFEELEALTDEGIIEDKYYTYPPGGGCNHWDYPRVAFSGWQHVPCNDVNAIKTAIMNYGVVYAAIYAAYPDFDEYTGGIFYDNDNSCEFSGTNHGVSLIGWGNDEEYGTYWILRNSWDYIWGEFGYMRIQATTARVGSKVAYFIPDPITHKYFGYDMSESGIIESGSSIEYIFRNSIILNPGFEVEPGADFSTYYSPEY